MKKNNINKHEVICAFYDSTDETKTEHHDFMNILVKHRWRLRPLYFMGCSMVSTDIAQDVAVGI